LSLPDAYCRHASTYGPLGGARAAKNPRLPFRGIRESDITKLSVHFVLGAAAHGEQLDKSLELPDDAFLAAYQDFLFKTQNKLGPHGHPGPEAIHGIQIPSTAATGRSTDIPAFFLSSKRRVPGRMPWN
jgi:hypothetical protein